MTWETADLGTNDRGDLPHIKRKLADAALDHVRAAEKLPEGGILPCQRPRCEGFASYRVGSGPTDEAREFLCGLHYQEFDLAREVQRQRDVLTARKARAGQ